MIVGYDEASQVLRTHGGYGSKRVYATYLDGVYKDQITGVKSVIMLDELTSAYRVKLEVHETSIADLVSRA